MWTTISVSWSSEPDAGDSQMKSVTMPSRRVFVSQPWPSASEVAWAHQFADALRSYGWHVFEEWNVENNPPMEAVREALHDSDLIVLLLDDAKMNVPTFYFYFGAASKLDKPMVAVMSSSKGASELDIPIPQERRVFNASPSQAAAEVLSLSEERLPA